MYSRVNIAGLTDFLLKSLLTRLVPGWHLGTWVLGGGEEGSSHHLQNRYEGLTKPKLFVQTTTFLLRLWNFGMCQAKGTYMISLQYKTWVPSP